MKNLLPCILLLFFMFVHCREAHDADTLGSALVLGGQASTPNLHHYLARTINHDNGNQPWCTASILQVADDPSLVRYVLTATHCFENPNVNTVGWNQSIAFAHPQTGEPMIQNACRLVKVHGHEGFLSGPYKIEYDIAVAEIDPACPIPSHVRPLPIAIGLPPAGTYYTIGYGQQNPAVGPLAMFSYDISRFIQPDPSQRNYKVLGNDKGVCPGDSGGPLLVQVNGVFAVAGNVYGYEPKGPTVEHCTPGRINHSIYVNTFFYSSWIESRIKRPISKIFLGEKICP